MDRDFFDTLVDDYQIEAISSTIDKICCEISKIVPNVSIHIETKKGWASLIFYTNCSQVKITWEHGESFQLSSISFMNPVLLQEVYYTTTELIDRVKQFLITNSNKTLSENEISKKELKPITELEKTKAKFYYSKCSDGPLPKSWTGAVLKLKLLKYDYAKVCKAAAKWKKRAKEFERHNKLLIEHNEVLENDLEIMKTSLKQEQNKKYE